MISYTRLLTWFAWIMLPLTWYIHMNNYFGWNMRPINDAECIGDGITLILFGLAWLITQGYNKE